MRKVLLTIMISFSLAILNSDNIVQANRRPVPIVYRVESLPEYGRKKPLAWRYLGNY